jgi:hypothetical protein
MLMTRQNALSCAALLLTLAAPAFAQDAQPSPAAASPAKAAPTTAFSINPAMLLLGGISVEAEHAVHPNISFFVAPSFIFGNSLLSDDPDLSTSGFGADGGLRFYIRPHAPKGFWLGPRVGVAFANATSGRSKASATAYAFGGMLGYSWITSGSFYFSVGGGADYTVASVEENILSPVGSDAGSSVEGVSLSLRLALGFAL